MIINEEMDNVEVRYMQRPDKTKFYQVLVRSSVNPTLKKIGEFEQANARSEKKTAQLIGVLAGAMAEELCEQYDDTIDPSNAARAAVEAYTEMMADQKGIILERDTET